MGTVKLRECSLTAALLQVVVQLDGGASPQVVPPVGPRHRDTQDVVESGDQDRPMAAFIIWRQTLFTIVTLSLAWNNKYKTF